MVGKFLVGVGIILEEDGKVLLAKRASHRDFAPNLWEFPAGRLEKEEDPEDALRREGEEELNLQIEPIRLVDAYTFHRNGISMVLITYHCKGMGKLVMSDEHDELRWCSPQQALNLLSFELQKNTLRKFLKFKTHKYS